MNRLISGVFAATVLAFTLVRSVEAQTYILDNFDQGTALRIVQPQATAPLYKNFWGIYSAGAGAIGIVTTEKQAGTGSLKYTHVSGANLQMQAYPYTENLSGWSNGWKYVRQMVNNPSLNPAGGSPAWPLNKINRLRFWIKLPPGISSNFPNHNFEFGTYIRNPSTGESVAESDNGHFYHALDLRSHGQWEQVIIDTHPDHQRGNSGNDELRDSPLPTAGYTYFDLMTRFYIDIPYAAVPGDYYVDGFEFYQETNPENTAQVRSIHAAYIPSSKTLEVGWKRPKNEDGINHEVRYSFSSIHQIGWANATVPANSVVVDQGNGGYNSMRWSSSAINLAGKSVIYVAIKPQNSTSFRQIAIPLTASSEQPVPNPPTNVKVN